MVSDTTKSALAPIIIYSPTCDFDSFTTSELIEIEGAYGALIEYATQLKEKERHILMRKFRMSDIKYNRNIICIRAEVDGTKSYHRYRCLEEAMEHTFYGECTVGFSGKYNQRKGSQSPVLYIKYKSGAWCAFYAILECEGYIYEDVHQGIYQNEEWYLRRLIEDGEVVRIIGKAWVKWNIGEEYNEEIKDYCERSPRTSEDATPSKEKRRRSVPRGK